MNRAYTTARREWVDPRQVSWAATPVDREAVEHYKRYPHQPYRDGMNSDGDPFIIRRPTGELVGCNGKHRAIAAAETGRPLWARVHNETPTTADPTQPARRRQVESNDIELVLTVAANACRCGYLLAGPTERVYARDADHPHTVVRVPGWEDDAVHQLLHRHWLTRGGAHRVTCGAVTLTATAVLAPTDTRQRVARWQHWQRPANWPHTATNPAAGSGPAVNTPGRVTRLDDHRRTR